MLSAFKPHQASHRYAAIFLATVLAVLLDLYPIHLFSGSQLVFGNIVAVALTLMYGLWAGLICSFVAGLFTYLNWEHLLILAPFLLEVAIINWALVNQKRAVLTGLLYWLSFGWIIVGLEYYYLTDYLFATKLAIVIAYVINGFLNIIFGCAIASYFKIYSTRFRQTRNKNYSQILTYTIFLMVTLSVLFVSYFWLKGIQKEKLNKIEKQLQLKSIYVSSEVENYISYHQRGLVLTVSNHPTEQNPEKLTVLLKHIANTYPTILTLLATDAQGTILATNPEILLYKIRRKNLQNISYRSYFINPKINLKPYVSNVFQGRGFGNDPIIALSVPFHDEGVFFGIIEASLDLTLFTTLDTKSITDDEGLLILDENNKVIYHSPQLNYQFLQDLSDNPILDYLENKESYFFKNNDDYLILESSPVPSLGWKIISTIPRDVYETSIRNYVLKFLSLLLIFILVSYVISRRITTIVSEPLNQLSLALSGVKKAKDFEKFNIQIDHKNVTEFQKMQDKLNEFANRLRSTVLALKKVNKKKKKYNKELQHINKNLETLVEGQTRELKKALFVANEASKTKDEFLATMSHEIRTPLNGVIGMLELMSHTDNHKDLIQYAAVAKSSANTLMNLINDILDISKIGAGKLRLEKIQFCLYSVLDSIISTLKYTADIKGIALKLDADSIKGLNFIGDPGRIRQIFINLVSNAIKFTSDGEVVLKAELTSEDNSHCIISALVTDTGIGIPSEIQAALFQTFTQADSSTTRKYGGSGLGLAICKNLIALMKGSIDVKSEVDKGSTFFLTLPLVKISEKETEPLETSKQPIRSWNNKVNILLVEDNIVNQQIVSVMLKKHDLVITLATNGQQAIDKLNKSDKKTAYDLILMDCQMPVMDGYSAAQLIRSGGAGTQYKDIPIIALTANAMQGDREKCIKAGMNDYLSKPVNIEVLMRLLQQHL